jgi:hypothetical protein
MLMALRTDMVTKIAQLWNLTSSSHEHLANEARNKAQQLMRANNVTPSQVIASGMLYIPADRVVVDIAPQSQSPSRAQQPNAEPRKFPTLEMALRFQWRTWDADRLVFRDIRVGKMTDDHLLATIAYLRRLEKRNSFHEEALACMIVVAQSRGVYEVEAPRTFTVKVKDKTKEGAGSGTGIGRPRRGPNARRS